MKLPKAQTPCKHEQSRGVCRFYDAGTCPYLHSKKRGREESPDNPKVSNVPQYVSNITSTPIPFSGQRRTPERTVEAGRWWRKRRPRTEKMKRVINTPSLIDFLNDFTSMVSNKSIFVLHDVILSVEEKLILSLRLNFIPPQLNEPNWSLNDNFLKFQRNVRLKYMFLFNDKSIISVDKRDFNNSLSENKLHTYVNSLKTFDERQLTLTPGKASVEIEEYLSHVEKSLDIICQNQNKKKRYTSAVPQSFFLCLKQLKYKSTKGNLIITEADKNLGTVVMDRTQYELQALGPNQLGDKNTYEKLNGPPVLKVIKNQLSDIFKREKWLNQGFLANRLLTDLCFNMKDEAHCGRMFYFPKMHKPADAELSFRPLCSSPGTSTYLTSKYLAFELRQVLRKITSHCRNSADLILELEKTVLPDDGMLLTIDIANKYVSFYRYYGRPPIYKMGLKKIRLP